MKLKPRYWALIIFSVIVLSATPHQPLKSIKAEPNIRTPLGEIPDVVLKTMCYNRETLFLIKTSEFNSRNLDEPRLIITAVYARRDGDWSEKGHVFAKTASEVANLLKDDMPHLCTRYFPPQFPPELHY
jgi:hypothetical protein